MVSFIVPNSKLILLFELDFTLTTTKETKEEKLFRRKLFLHWCLALKKSSFIRSFFYEIQNTQLDRNEMTNFLSLKNALNGNKTIFHLASQEGNIELMTYILDLSKKADFDLNLTDSMANTALHLIVINKKISSLQFLLDYLAVNGRLDKLDFNLKNNDGLTPLHLAINQGLVQAVPLLCNYGYNKADLDMTSEAGEYLAKAFEKSTCDTETKKKLLQELVKCGANPTPSLVTTHGLDMKYENKIRNLIFEGGGCKIAAYCGALSASYEKNLFNWNEIVNVGGTSAGAITASLLATGYSFKEVIEIFTKLDYASFLDHNQSMKKEIFEMKDEKFSLFKMLKFSFECYNHLASNGYGLFDGKVFLDEAESYMSAKMGKHATFQELAERIEREKNEGVESQLKYLFLIGSNLKTGQSDIFSHLTTPNMIISDAMRISMSLPFIWPPHKYYIKDERGQRVVHPYMRNVNYIDGGMFKNYPIQIFDRKITTDNSQFTYTNFETLGFRLRSREGEEERAKMYELDNEKGNKDNDGLVTFLKSVFGFFVNRESSEHSFSVQNNARTVFIDTLDYGVMDFNLSLRDKELLFKSGEKAVDEYIDILKSAKQRNF
jgi:NTE family protein